MGVDLLLAYVPWTNLSLNGRRQKLRDLIDHIQEEDLKELSEEVGCETIEEARDTIREAMEDYEQFCGIRTCTLLAFGDCLYAFSGGMSYGEEPSDAFTLMGRISMVVPLIEILFQWSREDVAQMIERERNRSDRTTPG